jgi:hypothetical protein
MHGRSALFYEELGLVQFAGNAFKFSTMEGGLGRVAR